MTGRKAFALLMAMRMRKTKVIIDDFGRLELDGEVADLFVLAPAGAYRTWSGALDDDLSEDLKSRLAILVWPASGKKLEAFLAHRGGPRALLMNVEALSRPGRGRDASLAFLGARPGQTYVAIDESTCVKNKSKRTKFVIEQIRPLAAWRRLLSGLATPRSPLDLYYQFEFLDPKILGHDSWYTFRASVAHLRQEWFGSRSVVVIDQSQGDGGIRHGAADRLKTKIAPHSLRVEFNPLVPSTFSFRDVDMTEEQSRIYREIKTFASAKLDASSHVTATMVMAQITRLHQVLMGHVVDEIGNEHLIPENRTDALMTLLEDYGGKAVIWANYDHDVRKVSIRLEVEYGPGSVARFWGGNAKTREVEEVSFKTDPKCRFMVATPDSGGKGRTWDVADLAIYYSNRDNLEHRDQSEQRTMGRDKVRGVENIDLICRGTVEEKIIESLRKKINMASAINGDNYREWLI